MPNPIEQAASKTMGAAKVAKATLKGLTGVFKHLMQEHGEVSVLMKRVSMSSDAQVRREHYPKIRMELLSHERAEIAEVYALLGRREDTREMVADHNAEARDLEAAIRGLDMLDPTGSEWGPAFERMAVLVEEHVAEEESNFFPRAQEAIGEDLAKTLLSAYEARKGVIRREIEAQSPPVAH